MKILKAFSWPWLIPSAIALLSFGLYLSVMPHRLTTANYGSDGGDFLAAILTGGIPHPTGYPTYVILGRLFQWIPLGTPYTRAVLLSMAPAALASGLLALLVGWHIAKKGEEANWVAGMLSGLVLGVSPLLWSQAVIVEVHGLQSFLIVTALAWISLLMTGLNTRLEKPLLVGLAILFGAGLGNHVTLVFLAPAVALGFFIAYQRGLSARWLIIQALMVLAGLSVYLYLPIQARHYPPVNWGNPQTLEGFLWVITGSPYQRLLFETPSLRAVERVLALAGSLRSQFGVWGVVLGIIGLMQYPFAQKAYRWVLVWILVIYSAFAIGYNTDDSTAYLLPAFMVFAALTGLGVAVLQEIRWRGFSLGYLAAMMVIILTLVNVPRVRASVDPRRMTEPADFAEKVLQTLPPGSLVLTKTDRDTFPLWYYHFGLGKRKDIAIVVLPLTQFPWYQETLIHTYPEVRFPEVTPKQSRGQAWGERVPEENPGRVVCRTEVQADQHMLMECSNGVRLVETRKEPPGYH